MQESYTMTWSRPKEELRAHVIPGWCDEFPEHTPRNESAFQLATWEGEGGRTAAPPAQRTFITV